MSQLNQHAEAGPVLRDEVDPELVALPAPPRGRRFVAMTVMALTVVASLALLMSLRRDITYFFAPARVTELGEIGSVQPASLTPNTYVRVTGTPMVSGTVRYSRLISGADYAVFPLAGQRTVFVQVPIEGPDHERTFARREYSGRLVTFGQMGGRFAQVRAYLDRTMDMPVSSESFLLLTDETPTSYTWALGLGAVCILFLFINVWLFVRWFRPIRDRAVSA